MASMSEINATQELMVRFERYLDQNHLRKTPERLAVAERAVNMGSHFQVEQLLRRMERDGFMVSRATVYNSLELLLNAGLLRRVVYENLQVQYEKVAAPHVHLQCTLCGKLKEVRDPQLIGYMNARKFTAFTTHHYAVMVYGLCNTCARKLKRGPSKEKNNKKQH